MGSRIGGASGGMLKRRPKGAGNISTRAGHAIRTIDVTRIARRNGPKNRPDLGYGAPHLHGYRGSVFDTHLEEGFWNRDRMLDRMIHVSGVAMA